MKKFIDNDNTFVFIESEGKLIMWLNGESQYTFTEIEKLPETIEDAYRISGLNIWYSMEEI